jgi:hypothetical protein
MSRIRNTGTRVISFGGIVLYTLDLKISIEAKQLRKFRSKQFFFVWQKKTLQDMAPPMHEEEFANMAVKLSTLTDTAILPTFHINSEDSAES